MFLVVLDINECSESFGDNCTENSNCTNTEGSYFCSCLSGYQKDGEKCTGKHAFQTPYSFAFAEEEIHALISFATRYREYLSTRKRFSSVPFEEEICV